MQLKISLLFLSLSSFCLATPHPTPSDTAPLLPNCAIACLTTALDANPICAGSDLCICDDTKMLTNIASCVIAAGCPVKWRPDFTNFVRQLCGSTKKADLVSSVMANPRPTTPYTTASPTSGKTIIITKSTVITSGGSSTTVPITSTSVEVLASRTAPETVTMTATTATTVSKKGRVPHSTALKVGLGVGIPSAAFLVAFVSWYFIRRKFSQKSPFAMVYHDSSQEVSPAFQKESTVRGDKPPELEVREYQRGELLGAPIHESGAGNPRAGV